MKRRSLLLVAILLSLSSCEEQKHAKGDSRPPISTVDRAEPSKDQPAALPAGTTQRFLPLAETPGAGTLLLGVPRPLLALDTVTGQLCRAVHVEGASALANASRYGFLLEVPECEALYRSGGK